MNLLRVFSLMLGVALLPLRAADPTSKGSVSVDIEVRCVRATSEQMRMVFGFEDDETIKNREGLEIIRRFQDLREENGLMSYGVCPPEQLEKGLAVLRKNGADFFKTFTVTATIGQETVLCFIQEFSLETCAIDLSLEPVAVTEEGAMDLRVKFQMLDFVMGSSPIRARQLGMPVSNYLDEVLGEGRKRFSETLSGLPGPLFTAIDFGQPMIFKALFSKKQNTKADMLASGQYRRTWVFLTARLRDSTP